MSLLICLTVYKRNHLEKQLKAIYEQSIQPDYLIVFQNENHVNIEYLKEKYKFLHVKNDYNTKFFGRFAYCFNFDVEYCIILDDDIIPGSNCIQNYLSQCKELNGIIGGNGRYCINNPLSRSVRLNDTGKRNSIIEVDFVGHLWCFKKEWLFYMFSIKPCTLDTGEDMHLCFTSKILGGIKSYLGKQTNLQDECDLTQNNLASDAYSSFKNTSRDLRKSVEDYFIKEYNLCLVK